MEESRLILGHRSTFERTRQHRAKELLPGEAAHRVPFEYLIQRRRVFNLAFASTWLKLSTLVSCYVRKSTSAYIRSRFLCLCLYKLIFTHVRVSGSMHDKRLLISSYTGGSDIVLVWRRMISTFLSEWIYTRCSLFLVLFHATIMRVVRNVLKFHLSQLCR